MLARKAMQSVEKSLTFLRPNVYQQGFAKLVVSAVSEFKRYGVLPSQLREMSEKISDDRLGLKLRDLSIIYEKFDEIVENEYNLNIPRYVDTFEEEEIINIDEVNAEIADLKTRIAEVEKQMAKYLEELGLN